MHLFEQISRIDFARIVGPMQFQERMNYCFEFARIKIEINTRAKFEIRSMVFSLLGKFQMYTQFWGRRFIASNLSTLLDQRCTKVHTEFETDTFPEISSIAKVFPVD